MEIKVGALCWNQYTDWPSVLEAARRADRLGYDDIWTWDHLYPIVGSPNGPMLEPWLMLATWATATERARIGLMVGANPYREPSLVAKMVTTLDHISGGRAILGIGAGWNEVEGEEFGFAFGDGSYDLVVCSEVIEHLSRPALAIGELMRVARKYVIVSTAEFSPLGEVERRLRVLTLDRDYPHAELNWFAPDDFRLLMGDNTVMSPQFRGVAHHVSLANRPQSEVARILLFLSDVNEIGVDQTGVIAIQAKDGSSPQPPHFDAAWTQATLDRLLDGPTAPPPVNRTPSVDTDLERRLQCPQCGGGVQLRDSGTSVTCTGCAARYAVTQGVPVMLADESAGSTQAAREAECAARLAGGREDRRQRILRLMAQLHDSSAGRHGPAVHWVAGQCLRVVWLFGRPEPLTARLGRVTRRVLGAANVDQTAIATALAWTPPDESTLTPAGAAKPTRQ